MVLGCKHLEIGKIPRSGCFIYEKTYVYFNDMK